MMYKVSPNVIPQMQPSGACCWLTCLEMLYVWKNNKGDKSKKIGSILSDMDQSPNLYPYFMQEKGIAPGECRETARMLKLGCSGETSVLDPHILTGMLKSNGPLWIAGKWYLNCDHVLVITGCNPETGKIKYVNPWRNYTGEESEGPIGWLANRGNEWTNCDASIMYWR